MSEGHLYKRLDEDRYIRHDPCAPPGSAGEYVIVPAAQVPALQLAAQRVRLSVATQRADPGARVRQLVALAMLDVGERGHLEGDPTGSIAPLLTLAQVAGDRAAQRQLRLPWTCAEDAPRSGVTDFAEHSHAQAEALLRRGGVSPTGPSHADLSAMVVALHRVPVASLRRAWAVADSAWGGEKLRAAGLVDRLVQHAHTQVNRPAPSVLKLTDITIDSGIQPRAKGMDDSKATEYAEAIKDGDEFPPLIVYQSAGGTIGLSEGFHRAEAYKRAGVKMVPCIVRKGEREDARLNAQANHGRG